MPETLDESGGIANWTPLLIEHDLVEQAHLNHDDFEQELLGAMRGYFKYKGRKVVTSHKYDKHLVVSMPGPENLDFKELIDGFSTVVGYRPFCRYELNLGKPVPVLPTYEWDKINPKGRLNELRKRDNLANLVLL